MALGKSVAMLHAELTGGLLGERIAIALPVCRANEGSDHFEIPLGHIDGLAPEIRDAEVDVELEQIDT